MRLKVRFDNLEAAGAQRSVLTQATTKREPGLGIAGNRHPAGSAWQHPPLRTCVHRSTAAEAAIKLTVRLGNELKSSCV